MSTLRKIVSNVRSTHRLLSMDNMLPDRAIASAVKRNSLLLVKRETNIRKLWATDTLFTTIPCLEMIEVPVSECSDYSENLMIARSKYKLPRIAEGAYNYVIQGVYSINIMGGSGKKIKEISINRYINLLKLSNKKNEEYFWINDDYLYVTSSFVKKVRISALFEEDIPNHIMFPECDGCFGNDINLEDYCMNPLDKKFFLPGYLEKQVVDLTSKTLMETYYQLQQDVTNDGIDGQARNSTPTQ